MVNGRKSALGKVCHNLYFLMAKKLKISGQCERNLFKGYS